MAWYISEGMKRDALARAKKIRTEVDQVVRLLGQAYDCQDHRVLGYKSFVDYARDQFQFSRAHTYRLLGYGSAIEKVHAAASPTGDSAAAPRVHIPERRLRGIIQAGKLDDMVAEVRQAPERMVDIVDAYAIAAKPEARVTEAVETMTDPVATRQVPAPSPSNTTTEVIAHAIELIAEAEVDLVAEAARYLPDRIVRQAALVLAAASPIGLVNATSQPSR